MIKKLHQASVWIVICFLHFPSYGRHHAHIWGGEDTRSGIWQPKSYILNHGVFKPINHPEKCEERSCITLHISCTYADYNNMDQKKFSASVLIERHPDHPKQANPFKVPGYSSKASIWLNGKKYQALLERSSLFVSFLYGTSYFWTLSFDVEFFDIMSVKQINFRTESEDQLLKVQAVFDLSQEQGVLKYMKSICPRPKKEESEKTTKNTKKPFFSIKDLIQK